MKRIISGIQPTNNITLGNYLGSIKEFVKFQDSNEMFVFVANLHSLTTKNIDADLLRQNSRDVIKTFIACGLNPEKVCIFYQSDILEHAMLEHILMCNTTLGELNRMTQFKDKSEKAQKQNNGTTMIPTGLLIYPVLMASDILLYDADLVPVGADQKQHLELTRNIAIRFNNQYKSELFKIPEPSIPKVGARVMDLQNPNVKMSKSAENTKGVIFLNDPLEISIKKIKSAITDNFNNIKFDIENQPGVSNLIGIYSSLSGLSINEIEEKFNGKNYGELKNAIIDEYTKFHEEYTKKWNSLTNNLVDELAKKCAIKAKKVASTKLNQVYKAIGLL